MFAGCRCSAVLLGGPSCRSLCRAEARDGGRRSDAGSIVLTSASTRSSTSSNSARLFGTALVFDVAGSSSLALVLGVACSPGRTLLLNIGCTPSCLLLRTVATLALAVAVLAPPLACVCGRRSGQRARASTGRAPSQPCVRLGAATTCTYIPGDFNGPYARFSVE